MFLMVSILVVKLTPGDTCFVIKMAPYLYGDLFKELNCFMDSYSLIKRINFPMHLSLINLSVTLPFHDVE